jgi:DNA invertase Pin-like site-specific DNA recombinase
MKGSRVHPDTIKIGYMTTAQRIGYRRVSTSEQNTARQLEGVELDKVFEDKASGSTTDRPQLQAAVSHLRPGDTFIVHSMDRLARNLADLQGLVDGLTGRGIRVEFIKDNLTFQPGRDIRDRLLLQLLGAVAEFERSMIRERQREGIDMAKERGVYKGRTRKISDPVKVAEIIAAATVPGAVKAQVAKAYGISRETLYQYINASKVH